MTYGIVAIMSMMTLKAIDNDTSYDARVGFSIAVLFLAILGVGLEYETS